MFAHGACSKQVLLSETLLFKDFEEDLHTVTHVRELPPTHEPDQNLLKKQNKDSG